ncbi:MAG: hypothetical protein ETSY2_18885, partial [Candidatus Entotheonella gemina]
ASHGDGLPRVPTLTTEIAEKMAIACEKYGQAQEGWRPLNIAIVDAGGELFYFRRDPTSFKGSIEIAINKAWTATRFGFPTRAIGGIVNSEPGKVHGIQFMDRLIIFPGGQPIVAADTVIGGIGVSGATGDQDEECAKAGLDAVKDMLQ